MMQQHLQRENQDLVIYLLQKKVRAGERESRNCKKKRKLSLRNSKNCLVPFRFLKIYCDEYFVFSNKITVPNNLIMDTLWVLIMRGFCYLVVLE